MPNANGLFICLLGALTLIALVWLLRPRNRDLTLTAEERVCAELERSRAVMDTHVKLALDLKTSLERVREDTTLAITDRFARLQASVHKSQTELIETLANMQRRIDLRLQDVRKDSTEQLEKIRQTVDEKLHATLENRLGESFRLVSERLEQLHKGLGEMQEIARGVGDLRRVLTNVRARGTFGEVQLAGLLEQVLTKEQYCTNVVTIPGRSERVEFAIKLPGRDRDRASIFLPIDAKFPLEDYPRLQQAYDDADAIAIETSRRALKVCLLKQAHMIQEKYVSPPHTTDFALMFLPTEGLYAEALRIPGLTEELQNHCRVVTAGPTTLYAILNSLQMGFRTLAIERRSSEVWQVLGAVKTEFERFGSSLEAVSKKLQEAGNKIAETSQRTRVMKKKLSAVEALSPTQTDNLLVGTAITEGIVSGSELSALDRIAALND